MGLIKKISELEQMPALSDSSNVIIEENGVARRFPAKEIGGTDKNPDRHAEFFGITEDGTIFLKREYRGATTQPELDYSVSDNEAGGAGSKNAELPKYLVIPETVNGITVTSLADGMFCGNAAIVEVVLPYMITAIPQCCFNCCNYLQEVYNTENITEIATKALRRCSSLKRAKFPKLKSMGANAMNGCGRLIYADVGDVTELPLLAFAYDAELQRIKNNGKLTTVGDCVFCKVTSLTHFENIENLKNIGEGAFIGPKIDFDKDYPTGRTLLSNATHLQFNPDGIGDPAKITYTPHENPIPTYFAQTNPALEGVEIGENSELTFDDGCMLFSFTHAYCGLKNISISTIDQLKQLYAEKPEILRDYKNDDEYLKGMAQKMGLDIKSYLPSKGDVIDNGTIQELYTAIREGCYPLIPVDNGWGVMSGHIFVVYGINDRGELLAVDSSSRYYDDFSKPFTYSFRFDKLCSPNKSLHILSLPKSDSSV